MDKVKGLHSKIKETSTFVGSYFKKNFFEELSVENQEEVFTPLEIRDNLKRMLAFAKEKKMPQSLQSSLLHELIMNGIQVGIFDEDIFRSYMQNTLEDMGNQVVKKLRKAQDPYQWNNYISNVQCAEAKQSNYYKSQSKFVKEYLQHFCIKKGSLESFQDIFESKVLKEAEEFVAVTHHGKDLTDLSMSQSTYEAL